MSPILAFGDLLGMSWDILTFVVTYIWILCLMVFLLIMTKTMVDLSKKIITQAGPGWRKILGSRKRR
jgi:hypothetical protein